MILKQYKNNNRIQFEFKEYGINYTLVDSSIKKTEFIPYENIENDSYELFEKNDYYKNNAIYTGVVGVIFLAINIIYQTTLWSWLFLIACPTFAILFKRSKTDFKVINVEDKIDIYIIKDEKFEEINSLIYSKRNEYLKENYYAIDYDNDVNSEIGKFKWLRNIGVINDREFNVIREELINNE